jgi:hypothetical protein
MALYYLQNSEGRDMHQEENKTVYLLSDAPACSQAHLSGGYPTVFGHLSCGFFSKPDIEDVLSSYEGSLVFFFM